MSTEIIPAVLVKTFEELEDRLADFGGVANFAHVDVCDGSLTPARTWPYQSVKPDMHFEAIISEEEGFPFWQEVDFEAHLMVAHPENIVGDWVAAGASRIIAHVEAMDASRFAALKDACGGIVELGLAIALDTANETLAPYADDISVIQCMDWNFSHLGRQGQVLDEGIFNKIAELRKLYPEHVISVDGGVTLENAQKLIAAGAGRLVIGSALWEGGNLAANFVEFSSIIGK